MYNVYNYLSKLYGKHFGDKKCKVCDKRFSGSGEFCSESCFFDETARIYTEQKIENKSISGGDNQVLLNKENEFRQD